MPQPDPLQFLQSLGIDPSATQQAYDPYGFTNEFLNSNVIVAYGGTSTYTEPMTGGQLTSQTQTPEETVLAQDYLNQKLGLDKSGLSSLQQELYDAGFNIGAQMRNGQIVFTGTADDNTRAALQEAIREAQIAHLTVPDLLNRRAAALKGLIGEQGKRQGPQIPDFRPADAATVKAAALEFGHGVVGRKLTAKEIKAFAGVYHNLERQAYDRNLAAFRSSGATVPASSSAGTQEQLTEKLAEGSGILADEARSFQMGKIADAIAGAIK